MAGQNSGKMGNFKTIKQAKDARKKAEAKKKAEANKRRAGLNKSKKKPK